MFSTAKDIAKYAAMWLNDGKPAGDGHGHVLSGASVAAATRSYTEDKVNANRGLGWVLKGMSGTLRVICFPREATGTRDSQGLAYGWIPTAAYLLCC